MTWRHAVVGLVTGLSLALAGSRTHAACGVNDECEGDLICEAGTCVAPQPPASEPAPPVKTEMNSPEMLGGGIAMVSIGVLSLAAAVPVAMGEALASGLCAQSSDPEMPLSGNDCPGHGVSTGLAVLGLVLIGGGVPLIVIGAKRVPVQSTTATLRPWVGPRGAGATLQLEL